MGNLQLHQLRVGAVASQLGDSLKAPMEKDAVVAGCLLHDMGNIVKFNLERFPEFNKPEGLEYWQKVQNEFKAKYGNSEHEATYAIAKELDVSKKVFDLVHDIEIESFEHLASLSLEMQIRIYADFRVGPFGVISLKERFVDGKERYKDQKTIVEELERNESILFQLEQHIFEKSTIKPGDINDESVAPIIEELKNFEI